MKAEAENTNNRQIRAGQGDEMVVVEFIHPLNHSLPDLAIYCVGSLLSKGWSMAFCEMIDGILLITLFKADLC